MAPSTSQLSDSFYGIGMSKIRGAISAAFFLNGFVTGNWAPKIPVIMERMQIEEATMGFLILFFGIGSIVMMPIVGALMSKRGSTQILKILTLCFVPVLLCITLVNELWLMVVFVALFGATLGGMDIAMNANAVKVEGMLKRPIMSSCHGFWSLGGVAGAATGGLLINQFGEVWHAVIMTIVAAIIAVMIIPHFAQDTAQKTADIQKKTNKRKLRFPSSPIPYLIGIVSLFTMINEGAILDWSARYMTRELGASIDIAAYGFAAFSAAMAVMRFLGDGIKQKLGAVRTVNICTAIAIFGMGCAALAPNPYFAILGFAIAGIGLSNIVPIAFSAAGNIEGVDPNIALSIVSTMGYSGILVAPSAIGFIAQHTGFQVVFLGASVLLVANFFISRLLKRGEFSH